MTSQQQRAALQSQIWKIANDVRGAVDGWDFKQYEQDSFYDFARLIASNYKAAHASANDYKAYADKIAHSPYISEQNGDDRNAYMKGIISIYENILEIAKKKVFLSEEDSA